MSANFHPLVYIIDYILGVIMWTLIGRVAMNIFQREDSQFFFMRVFVKFTNPLINLFKPVIILGSIILLQIGLGILTVLSGASILTASLHQFSSILLITSSLYFLYMNRFS